MNRAILMMFTALVLALGCGPAETSGTSQTGGTGGETTQGGGGAGGSGAQGGAGGAGGAGGICQVSVSWESGCEATADILPIPPGVYLAQPLGLEGPAFVEAAVFSLSVNNPIQAPNGAEYNCTSDPTNAVYFAIADGASLTPPAPTSPDWIAVSLDAPVSSEEGIAQHEAKQIGLLQLAQGERVWRMWESSSEGAEQGVLTCPAGCFSDGSIPLYQSTGGGWIKANTSFVVASSITGNAPCD